MAWLKKKKNDKVCDHNFEDMCAIVIETKYPRMVSCCKKCGVCVHRQIYSVKKLAEVENNGRDE